MYDAIRYTSQEDKLELPKTKSEKRISRTDRTTNVNSTKTITPYNQSSLRSSLEPKLRLSAG